PSLCIPPALALTFARQASGGLDLKLGASAWHPLACAFRESHAMDRDGDVAIAALNMQAIVGKRIRGGALGERLSDPRLDRAIDQNLCADGEYFHAGFSWLIIPYSPLRLRRWHPRTPAILRFVRASFQRTFERTFVEVRVEVTLATYDHVIDQLDAKQVARLANSLGECVVFVGWRWIARWVVVGDDNGACARENGDSKERAGIDWARSHRSAPYLVVASDAHPGVEMERDRNLLRTMADQMHCDFRNRVRALYGQ